MCVVELERSVAYCKNSRFFMFNKICRLFALAGDDWLVAKNCSYKFDFTADQCNIPYHLVPC